MTGPDERLAVAVAFDTAASNGVGMSLGAWAGRGDWASCGTDFRDRAGQRALSEVDTLIENLTAYRHRLAAALEHQDGTR